MVEEAKKRGVSSLQNCMLKLLVRILHMVFVGQDIVYTIFVVQNIAYCWPEYCIMHLRILHIVFVRHNVTYCWSAEEGGPGEYCMENNPKTINRQRMRDVTSSSSYWVGLVFENFL